MPELAKSCAEQPQRIHAHCLVEKYTKQRAKNKSRHRIGIISKKTIPFAKYNCRKLANKKSVLAFYLGCKKTFK